MPGYLITLHAHGTWMPDRPQGYVQRHKGILPTDKNMADNYHSRTKHPPVTFTIAMQRLLIEAACKAAEHQSIRIHFIATDSSHVHLLVSSKQMHTNVHVRAGLKSSMTRKLNQEMHRRPWFAQSGSCKRVRDRKHFQHLVDTYLRSHQGLKYSEDEGYIP